MNYCNVAQDPNLLLRMDIVGDHVETWIRRELEWTDRHTAALLDVYSVKDLEMHSSKG